jgi:hypothetical protein
MSFAVELPKSGLSSSAKPLCEKLDNDKEPTSRPEPLT